jgi:hypothetical protein
MIVVPFTLFVPPSPVIVLPLLVQPLELTISLAPLRHVAPVSEFLVAIPAMLVATIAVIIRTVVIGLACGTSRGNSGNEYSSSEDYCGEKFFGR